MKLDFWKDNRLDQHFQVESEEFAERFREWVLSQEDWQATCNYYRCHDVATMFICNSNGLQSAWAQDYEDQCMEVHRIAYQVLWAEGGLMESAA